MKLPRKTSTYTLRIASLLLATGMFLAGPAFAATAKPGDVAKGKILSDDGTRLVLDTSPCNNPATKTVIFKKPYKKKPPTSTKCANSDTTYDAVEVEQLSDQPKDDKEKDKDKDKKKGPDTQADSPKDQDKSNNRPNER